MIAISIILFCLGVMFNAIMDTLKDHFGVSIFKHLNPDFWNPAISWNKGINLFGSWGGFRWMTIDSWHLSKFLMQFCFISSICFAWNANIIDLYYVPALVIGGYVLWGIVFELFYSFLLLKKN